VSFVHVMIEYAILN